VAYPHNYYRYIILKKKGLDVEIEWLTHTPTIDISYSKKGLDVEIEWLTHTPTMDISY